MRARRALRSCIALALLALLISCSAGRVQPRKAGDWMVELTEVQIGAADFNQSLLGEPLDIVVTVRENGREIRPSTPVRLSGQRGQRLLPKPMVWLVHFDPQRNYQMVVEEQALIAHTGRWEIPPTPRLGQWPFAAKDGLVRFGRESYLKFSLRKVEG